MQASELDQLKLNIETSVGESTSFAAKDSYQERAARRNPPLEGFVTEAGDGVGVPLIEVGVPRKDETIVCRCEDITLDEIKSLISQGYRTIDEIKRVIRAGMGPCQGRTCRMLIAQELAKVYGIPVGDVLMPTFRAPVKPVKLGTFAGGE